MAGIYIHIPFCKQACYYCDFHFSTSLKLKSEIIDAILKEIELRSDYLENEPIETIYFGGGTPSILDLEEIESILQQIYKYHSIIEYPEITLEANPDDLSKVKLEKLFKAGINRLSIGVQTFNNEILLFLNRAHNSEEAVNCIKNAQDVGFKNLNIDLIYGSDNTTNQILNNDLDIIEKLKIQHISAYNLTIEPSTVFDNWLKKGKIKSIDDSHSAEQYLMIENFLSKNGFEHYEISNYALPKLYSRHNTSYWKQKKYLGIGPSAHSFNGFSRSYTVKNNAEYLKSININSLPIETELLSNTNRINEYLMTGLRTIWGCDIQYFNNFDYNILYDKHRQLLKYQTLEYLDIQNNTIILTSKGRLHTDSIVLDLMN